MHSDSPRPADVVPLRRSRDHAAAPAAPRPEVPQAPSQEPAISGTQARILAEALRRRVRGEVRFDAGSQGLYSTDASNYRATPIGVVIPRDVDDVITTIQVCRDHDAPVLSRGGGTSLAGQCCNTGVIIDFSKHLHRIIDIDPERQVARVQPGVILDHMKRAAEPHHLGFGPDPATHDHCTLGGMIGNNSCGIHSVMSEFYGPGSRTADHVEEMDILTYEGLRMRVGRTSDEELARILAVDGPEAAIYHRLRILRDRYAPLIRERFPDIPRRVSGYNLDELLPERGFHVARALVGTESTCATVLEATIRLVPARPERALVVLGYEDVYAAGDHIPRIREFRPVGCEGIDDRLVDFMKKSRLHARYIGLLPEGGGWLLVEFGADTQEEAVDQARQMMAALAQDGAACSMRLVDDPEQMHHLWLIRESGLGATAFVPGEPDAWPGWEDSAVPPERIGPYLRDLRALLDEHGYACSLYGHFAQGCVHTRIDFGLRSAEGIEQYRRFTDAAADLCLRYGGSLSGEHGDGQSRGDLLVKMYGPELVEAFREFKAVWDPRGRMNPGKVIGTLARTQDLRLADYDPPEVQVRFAYPEDGGDFAHAAMRCVGVGECRKLDSGTMCPSYMATREEKHCTRGRARLLFEMMDGKVIRDLWASEAVKDALDLCLACKACKQECPVNVDMATYKAEFMAHYYQHEQRPRNAYAFGWIHRWARIGGAVPWLANFATQTPGLRRLAKLAAGVAPERRIPRFARRTFKRAFRKRGPGPAGDRRNVVLWPDTFNNHFFPDTLMAAVEVLESAGCRVIVPEERLCCGRALYDYGMLDLAKELWEATMGALGEHIAAGTPVVGLEPSCVSAFRDELPGLFPADRRARRLSELAHTLGEFLVHLDGYELPRLERRTLLHGHCHHKAIMGLEPEIQVLSAMGLDLDVLDAGCCGMAGAFGFEKEHYEVAMAAGERVLLPAVRAAPDGALIVADGFSCREQIVQGAGRRAVHLAEVIREGLRARTAP